MVEKQREADESSQLRGQSAKINAAACKAQPDPRLPAAGPHRGRLLPGLCGTPDTCVRRGHTEVTMTEFLFILHRHQLFTIENLKSCNTHSLERNFRGAKKLRPFVRIYLRSLSLTGGDSHRPWESTHERFLIIGNYHGRQ